MGGFLGAKQSLCRFSKRLKFKMPTALPCFHLTFGSKGLGFVPLDHGNAVISVQFTKKSSDSFKQLPLPSHCADGALQKAMMALPWRVLSCQWWGSDVWKAIWSPERIWSLENPEGEFLVLSNFYNPFLLSAYLQSDTIQKVWTTESLFPVRSLIWCDLWDLI